MFVPQCDPITLAQLSVSQALAQRGLNGEVAQSDSTVKAITNARKVFETMLGKMSQSFRKLRQMCLGVEHPSTIEISNAFNDMFDKAHKECVTDTVTESVVSL